MFFEAKQRDSNFQKSVTKGQAKEMTGGKGLQLIEDLFEGTPFFRFTLPEISSDSPEYYRTSACFESTQHCLFLNTFGGEQSFPSHGQQVTLTIHHCKINDKPECQIISQTHRNLRQILPSRSSEQRHRRFSLFYDDYRLRDSLFAEGLFFYQKGKACSVPGSVKFPSQTIAFQDYMNAFLSLSAAQLGQIILQAAAANQSDQQISLLTDPADFYTSLSGNGWQWPSSLASGAWGLELTGTDQTVQNQGEDDEAKSQSGLAKKSPKSGEDMDLAVARVLAGLGISFFLDLVETAQLMWQIGQWEQWVSSQKTRVVDVNTGVLQPAGTEANKPHLQWVTLQKLSGKKNLFYIPSEPGKPPRYYLRDLNMIMLDHPIDNAGVQLNEHGKIDVFGADEKITESYYPKREIHVEGPYKGLPGRILISNSSIARDSSGSLQQVLHTAIERHKYDPQLDSHLGAKLGNKHRYAKAALTSVLAALNAALLVYTLNDDSSDPRIKEKFHQVNLAVSTLNLVYQLTKVWDTLQLRADRIISSAGGNRIRPPRSPDSRQTSIRQIAEAPPRIDFSNLPKAGIKGAAETISSGVQDTFKVGGAGGLVSSGVLIVYSMLGILISAENLQGLELSGGGGSGAEALKECKKSDKAAYLQHVSNARNIRLALIVNTARIHRTLGDPGA